MSLRHIQKMSQKTKEIDNVFDPSSFRILYCENSKDEDVFDEKKKKAENDLYEEIVEGLKSDLEKLGMELTYSSKIIIGEIAMNILLLNRVKFEIICKGLLRDKKILKPEYISSKRDSARPSNTSKSISYEILHVHGDEEIHPLFDKLIPKLQKQINEGLKSLGLLPVQTIERQKLTIIKKLRQKYQEGTIEVKAEKQVNV